MLTYQLLCKFVIINVLILVTLAQTDPIVAATESLSQFRLQSDIGFKQENDVQGDGDVCFHYVRRINGICTNPNSCPEVIKDFQKGIQPQICSYIGARPIICCPQMESIITTNTIASTATVPQVQTVQTTNTSPPTTRLSETKCEEYSKLAVHRNIVGSFSVGERINNTVISSKCALSGGGGFIVGGTKTKAGEYPHMAVIGWKDESGSINWNCGGSLISYQFILTAAHCVSWRGVPPNIIRLGDQNLKRTDDGAEAQDFGIEKIIRNPDYRTSTKYNDIALFKLDQRIIATDFVRPACLWQTFNINYESAIATGWGLIKDRGLPSEELLKVSLKLITNERCDSLYERFNALRNGIVKSQLCAGDDYEEKDTCNGDSGKQCNYNQLFSFLILINIFFAVH